MTEPRDIMTFPYLVIEILVLLSGKFLAKDCATFSIRDLLMPIALIGYTALSVLKHTIPFTPYLTALPMTFELPVIFVATASIGKNSHDGTCFNAAA